MRWLLWFFQEVVLRKWYPISTMSCSSTVHGGMRLLLFIVWLIIPCSYLHFLCCYYMNGKEFNWWYLIESDGPFFCMVQHRDSDPKQWRRMSRWNLQENLTSGTMVSGWSGSATLHSTSQSQGWRVCLRRRKPAPCCTAWQKRETKYFPQLLLKMREGSTPQSLKKINAFF